METKPPEQVRRHQRAVRVWFTREELEALTRRAHRNDRQAWAEGTRIIREALERDGDLTSAEAEGRP